MIANVKEINNNNNNININSNKCFLNLESMDLPAITKTAKVFK